MGEYLTSLSEDFDMDVHLGYKGNNLAKLEIKPL
jgi:hypothetical protein